MALPALRCIWCPPPDSDEPCTRCGDETGEAAKPEAQPDYSGGCMLALYPPLALAKKLAVDDGLDPGEIHLTIAYTGDATDVDPEALKAAAAALAGRGPAEAAISGHARFTGGEQDVIVALADSAQIEDLRADALAVLAESGIDVPRDHGYTPHLTLRYLGADDPDPVSRLAAKPVTFTAISAVHGDNRTDYEFVPDAEIAEHAVAEVTIDLSSLQGIWADVYGRQDALYAQHCKKARRAWRKIIAALDVAALVAAFRKQALMLPTGPAPGTDHQSPEAAKHHKSELRKMAASMAAGLLAGVNDTPGYGILAAAVTAALTAAAGEGYASALAIAAAEAGIAGFAWNRATRDGQQPPSYAVVTAAVQAIIAGASADVARKLASLAIAGATAAEMTAAVRQALKDARSLTVNLTHAMSIAVAAAMQALYDAADVKRASWLTAGDSRVCASCEGLEAKNPWRLEEMPSCPDHFGCRCVVVPDPSLPLPAGLYAPYLPAAA